MKVFVVTSGDYSDYRIDAVFSSVELAEKFIAKSGDGSVEPWELDERDVWEKGPVFSAYIQKNDGEIRSWPIGPDRLRHPSHATFYESSEGISVESPVSIQHAEKVAVEKRQEWLRMKGGV